MWRMNEESVEGHVHSRMLQYFSMRRCIFFFNLYLLCAAVLVAIAIATSPTMTTINNATVAFTLLADAAGHSVTYSFVPLIVYPTSK